jgi:hypothetical protein
MTPICGSAGHGTSTHRTAGRARDVGEMQWGPHYGVTKDEHDAHVAVTGRPYTADPMRGAKTESDAGDPDVATGSIIDRVISQSRREAQ